MTDQTVDSYIEDATEELSVAVTLKAKGGKPGPIECSRTGTRGDRDTLALDSGCVKSAVTRLKKLGFKVSQRGVASVSVRGKRKSFEKAFGTTLSRQTAVVSAGARTIQRQFYAPAEDAPWAGNDDLYSVIDDAYIQWPHVSLNQRFDRDVPSPIAPGVTSHHLRVPGDVALMLNAARAHRAGFTGRGVKVAMVDSGFADHQYFEEMGYNTTTLLAPGANQPDKDGNGHGTGEMANLLAMAPDVEFVGIKLDNETDPRAGASLLEGFQLAVAQNPQIISVSLGFDLRSQLTGRPLTSLPNSLVALDTEILSAVFSGITVVFSAGNGHISFPGMMPEVISAGGVFVDRFGQMEASDYASAFTSSISIFNRRRVPDCSGLVGRASNNAEYLMLPIPPLSEIDRGKSSTDGTAANDGWGLFSGTSAAAPQLAGACALLLQKNPGLTPDEVRAALVNSGRAVRLGAANPASNPGRPPIRGRRATGGGLVDINAALAHV